MEKGKAVLIRRREKWSSQMGIILAVAGSAIGLGNFLRFPAKAVENGGGAFMIPYFISLILLGIPLMWIEWGLGRYGGSLGSGTAPGIFHHLCPKNRWLKYAGVLGILGPLIIFIYYTYIQSWTLAYSFFALTGQYNQLTDYSQMQSFLRGFQGLEKNQFFQGMDWAYVFFLITFSANIAVLIFGVRHGIEVMSKWALPILFFCGVVLFIRVLTLGAPHPAHPDWNVNNGLGFLWNPDFSSLKSAKVWLEASGQIFFTLSVGIGVILTYASYLSKKDDVTLSGLTSVATNEFAEVILGGSIVITAAFMFFGPLEMKNIVHSGLFNLGFVTMPIVLNQLPLSQIFSFFWFFLLFLAGLTSSVSLAQPFICFLEDDFGMTKKKAVGLFAIISFILCQPAIFFLKNGVVDELDFWGGSFFLVVFATIETILFTWVFGIDKAWEEMHQGARLKIPKFFKFIMKYVTPTYLITILIVWFWQDWRSVIWMKGVPEENQIYILLTRLGLLAMFFILVIMVRNSFSKRRWEAENI